MNTIEMIENCRMIVKAYGWTIETSDESLHMFDSINGKVERLASFDSVDTLYSFISGYEMGQGHGWNRHKNYISELNAKELV